MKPSIHTPSQGCESSDFNLIFRPFFLLFRKPHVQTFYALKSSSFQAFQIVSDFFSQMLSHSCLPYYLAHPLFWPCYLPTFLCIFSQTSKNVFVILKSDIKPSLLY